MMNEKLDNLLNLSLDSSEEERERSMVLSVGVDRASGYWEVIVKYNGSLQSLQDKYPQIQAAELLYQYGILQIPQELVDLVASDVQISYMEKPKSLFFAEEVIL